MVIQLSQDPPKPANHLLMHDHLICISFFCTLCLSLFDNDKVGETLNYLVFVVLVMWIVVLDNIVVLFYDLNDMVEIFLLILRY